MKKFQKNSKAAGPDEIPTDVWMIYFSDYKQSAADKVTKGYILPFLKKCGFEITKNFIGIMITGIAANACDDLLSNHIWPEIEKILSKNQNNFWSHRSPT